MATLLGEEFLGHDIFWPAFGVLTMARCDDCVAVFNLANCNLIKTTLRQVCLRRMPLPSLQVRRRLSALLQNLLACQQDADAYMSAFLSELASLLKEQEAQLAAIQAPTLGSFQATSRLLVGSC